MKKKYYVLLLIICILQIGTGIKLGTEKINFHVDEIYTFGLANNTTGTTMSVPYGELIDKSEINNYVTVDSNHCFDYQNVWNNQTADVHPPLYYMLIHTISSFYPEQFIPMIGIGINIFFSVIVTLLVYLITREMTHNELASVLSSMTWAFSLANMTFIVFIRMYMMLSVFVLAITLLHLKFLNKKLTFKFYISVFLLSILGALTQYYFLIYLFFLSLIFGIGLLFHKEFKSALLYIISYGAAGITSIVIFPGILKHIFFGYRGVESFENMTKTSDIWNRYKNFYSIINKELFNHFLSIIFILLFLLSLLFIIKNIRQIKCYKIFFSDYFLILFPTFFYFVIVSKISVYISDRYIMPIFPLILILVIQSITYLSSHLFKNKYIIQSQIGLFVLLSVVGLARNSNINYLYKETAPAIQFASDNYDSDVLVFYSGAWRLNSVYAELIHYEHTRFIPTKKLSKFIDTINNYGDSIVYIIGDDPDTTLDELIRTNPNWNSYSLVHTSQYANTYRLN